MGFESIIGYKEEKRELMQLKSILANAETYRATGMRLPKGVILCGAPGVGKTMMAKSLSGDGIRLVELRAADCCEDMTGSIREAFRKAKESAPSVLLLDELDKIAGTSNDFFMEMNDSVKKIILQELDALTEEDTVLVVATCNEYESLGAALTRTGRFDHTLHISLPDCPTRKAILDHYLGRIRLKKDCSTEYVARISGGFSCSDMECIANETGIRVLDASRDTITTQDLVAALNRQDFMGEAKNGSDDKEELRRLAVHEAGHAIVAMILTPDRVFGASILPQGQSLGHVRMMEEDDSRVTADDIFDGICTALAGRVAEKNILGKIYLGSEDDLNQASAHMRTLLTKTCVYGYKYLCMTAPFMHMCPDSLAESFVKEFEVQMNVQDERAWRIISDNMAAFNEIVNALMNKRALTREELLNIRKRAVGKAA